MKIRFVNTTAVCLSMLISGVANAGIIIWNSVQITADANDVLTLENKVKAYNATTTNSGSDTVNGAVY